MSEFVAGFVARHAAPAERLRAVMEPEPGFAARPPVRGAGPVGFAPRPAEPSGPKHFSPADLDTDPTEGWDPLDPTLDQPAVDAIEAARDMGYAEGLAVAKAAAEEASGRDRALIAGMLDALNGAGRIDREAMADKLRATVMMLVTRLVGEAGVSAELLGGRVAAAAEMLADAGESAILRLHPDDVPLLDGKLPDTIFAVGDAGVARGSFVLESASTVVEDGPGHWLEQLAGAIERVAVPKPASSC